METNDQKFKIERGSGYGYHEFTPGKFIRVDRSKRGRENWPEYLKILTASSQFIRDDGLSFGVGADDGYLYSATCRAATEEELAVLKKKTENRESAKEDFNKLFSEIQQNGEESSVIELYESRYVNWFDARYKEIILTREYIYIRYPGKGYGAEEQVKRVQRTDELISRMKKISEAIGKKGSQIRNIETLNSIIKYVDGIENSWTV